MRIASGLRRHRGIVGRPAGDPRERRDDRPLRHVDNYIDARLGGYGLFYARMLEAVRLTKPGAYQMADRATDRDADFAQAFARTFEQTRYYREFFEADVVPVEVLRDLGDHVCLCTIPGRSDHEVLLDVFVGDAEQELAWESLRQRRIKSFSLHLDLPPRPARRSAGDVDAFRATIASGRFSDGSPLSTPFEEIQNSWVAYQLRECQTLTLTALWSWYLQRLQETYPTTHASSCGTPCVPKPTGGRARSTARNRSPRRAHTPRNSSRTAARSSMRSPRSLGRHNGQLGGWLADEPRRLAGDRPRGGTRGERDQRAAQRRWQRPLVACAHA